MDCTVDETPVNHNLKCSVCGENKFEEREGFYYCLECGTKQEQVRLVEVERDEFDPEKMKTRKKKIRVSKVEKPQLTSWECYNYILRGFVEELLSFGAKEELKLMTLQVWAAYLRRMEVAFFNRKQIDLPKLGIKYFQNDAKAIYNHSKEARKKRKRRRSEDTSCTSGNESRSSKYFNRSKRKLDESNYSETSIFSGFSGLTSSTSANSNRAIKIEFSARARAFFKRKMPIKHLERHQADAGGLLKCHKQPKAREIKRSDYNMMLINIKQIYSVLAIALNLIGDDIQLCDLVRFINEGHIGTSNVLQYFPENIANNGKEMLKNINFSKCREKYNDKCLRSHIGMLCKNIGINQLKTPDLVKLVKRYITELCLPTGLSDYIERLINLLPPSFNIRTIGCYPGFEARAMAYIIFALKLFFGLDDSKEYRISSASKNLNSKIDELNRNSSKIKPLLFVWSEWTEYIEMRKVIISHFNSSFCEQFMQSQSTDQVLEQLAEEMRRTEENNCLFNDSCENLDFSHKLKTLKSIFERFVEASDQCNKLPTIEFQPSFTPAVSYLKKIFLLCDNNNNNKKSPLTNINIPDFMRIDHSERDINSYLQVKPFIEYFRTHQLNLNVHVLATNENKQYVGVFRTPRNSKVPSTLYKACFQVTEDEWSETVISGGNENADDLEFCTNLENYSSYSYYKQKKRGMKIKPYLNAYISYDLTMIQDTDDDEGYNQNIRKSNRNSSQYENKPALNEEAIEELHSMHSFQLFSEDNMNPIKSKNFITEPRRNLENIDLFEGISDEESVLNNDDVDANTSDDSSQILLHDNNDSLQLSPFICEEFIKIEPVSPGKAKEKNNKFSKSNDDVLKMYISNMDCWMILGHFLKTNKTQKSQLQDKFPRSFNWLLETCAQTINVEWSALFEQLLCIETMFCLGISNTETIKNCVYLNSCNSSKEIQMIINSYRHIW